MKFDTEGLYRMVQHGGRVEFVRLDDALTSEEKRLVEVGRAADQLGLDASSLPRAARMLALFERIDMAREHIDGARLLLRGL